MKTLSIKTTLFLSVWVICSGILILGKFGLLNFPSDMANKAYILGWLAASNALLTVMVERSKIALLTLTLGWMSAVILSLIDFGIVADGSVLTFGTLLASTLIAVSHRYVHIASYGGSGKVISANSSEQLHSDQNGWTSQSLIKKENMFLAHGSREDDDLHSMRHRAMESSDLMAQVPGRSYTSISG